jgi:hypothetical protein
MKLTRPKTLKKDQVAFVAQKSDFKLNELEARRISKLRIITKECSEDL